MRTVLLAAILVTASAGELAAQSWTPLHAREGTLGFVLEPHFTAVLQSCGIPQFRRRNTVYSSIPPAVQTALRVGDRVLVESEDAAAKFLTYMFPRADAESYNSLLSLRYFDSAQAQQSTLPIPDDAASQTTHYHNCNSIVDAALEAGVSLPTGSLRAAARAEFRDRASLALVRGRFRSPLAQSLRPSLGLNERLPALLRMWTWYHDNVDGRSVPPYYIDTFEGVALFRLGESARKREVKSSASIGIALAPVGARASASAASVMGSETSVQEFATLFALGPDNRRRVSFLQAPSIANIAQAVALVRPRLALDGPVVFRPGLATAVAYDVSGLVSPYCDESLWTLDGSTAPAVVSNLSLTPLDATCRIAFSMLPHATLFDNERAEVSFVLPLRTQAGLGDSRLNIGIEIAAQTSSDPVLAQVGSLSRWSVSQQAGRHTLTWEPAVQVIDHASRTVVTPRQIIRPQLHCDGGEVALLDVRPLAAEGNVFRLRLEAASPFNAPLGGDQPLQERSCTLSAVAELEVIGGGTPVRRPLTATIGYPEVRSGVSITSVELERVAVTGSLQIGISVQGALSPTDGRLLDGAYATAYEVVSATDANVQIDLESTEFDAVLNVVGPSGVIAWNDDRDSGTTDARVQLTLVAMQRYRIVVSSYRPGEIGGFTLRATAMPDGR